MKNIKLLSLTSLFLCAVLQIQAQINLSIQGTIQEASGANLENGEYAMTFRLYDTETGGTPVWSETQDVVDVIGGVYSTLLGKVNPLNAAFDKTYYLGVSLNYGAEVVPRTRLTASPYAFSMVGQNNVFPSVGAAGAGTSAPDNSAALHLKREGGTGVLLLESDVNSAVSMKKGNNKAKISYDGVRISVTNLNIGSINLLPGKTVIYEDRKDWRLVAVHNFSDINDDEYFTVNGWRANREDYASPRRAWATSSSDGIIRVLSQNKPFYRGKIMMVQSQPGNALKKEIDLTGIPHTMVKVVFTYHFLDFWNSDELFGYAGFGDSQAPYTTVGQNNGRFQLGWCMRRGKAPLGNSQGEVSPGYFELANAVHGDFNVRDEMIAQTVADKFWLIFSSNIPVSPNYFGETCVDVRFGVSDIEIWVK